MKCRFCGLDVAYSAKFPIYATIDVDGSELQRDGWVTGVFCLSCSKFDIGYNYNNFIEEDENDSLE